MNKLLVSLTLLALTLDASAEQPVAFKLKNRSSFHPGDMARNPFWPIGYKPATAPDGNNAAAVTPSDLQLKVDNFQVSSILLAGADSLAVINGKEFAQGETGPVQVGGAKLNVHVVAIGDGEVTLVCQSQSLNVPLRRK